MNNTTLSHNGRRRKGLPVILFGPRAIDMGKARAYLADLSRVCERGAGAEDPRQVLAALEAIRRASFQGIEVSL